MPRTRRYLYTMRWYILYISNTLKRFIDELIRQVTINGPERGLILLRVRDEIRMTLDAYKILYDSR